MNQRPFFNPRNFHPPPRNFLPPNQRAPYNPHNKSFNMPMNMQRPGHFNQNNETPRMSHQNFQQISQMPGTSQQMQEMQRKRPLDPPEPPKFSDLVPGREEPKAVLINPAYKTAIDDELAELDRKLKQYLDDPESHPFYSKEWQLFWNRKADELTKRGEDPADFDFKDEWFDFFIARIHEIYEEETKWMVEQIQRKFGEIGCEYPKLKGMKRGSMERDDVVDHKNDESDEEDYEQFKEEIQKDRLRMQESDARRTVVKVEDKKFAKFDVFKGEGSRSRFGDDRSRFDNDAQRSRFHGGSEMHKFSQADEASPNFLGNEATRSKFISNDLNRSKLQDNIDTIPAWKKPGPSNMQEQRRKPSRFDQPADEFDHPKFRSNSEQLFQQQPPPIQNYGFSGQNSPNSNSRQMGLPNSYKRHEVPSNYMHEPKKSKKALEKMINSTLRTIKLENVPLEMKIQHILDFFGNKLRGIVGCFRVIDYTDKIPSRIVYLILMDENEVKALENMTEIIMEGNYVRVSSAKLLNGSALVSMDSQEPLGAPQSLFLTNLEKRTVETTFYLKELAKLFESHYTITGIRICHNSKSKKSRNFGFVNFLSKASVNELDGREFKMFNYKIRCSNTNKIPLLISVDHSELLEDDKIEWNSQLRKYNLLNIKL